MYPQTILNITGGPYRGKTTTIRALVGETPPDSIGVFQPSKYLGDYAKINGIQLKSRAEYASIHQQLQLKNPDFMVEAILEMSTSHELVILDGLRKYTHARRLESIFGNNYMTCVLECSDEKERQRRAASDARFLKLGQVLGYTMFKELDIADYIDPNYEFEKTLGMHNLTTEPLDTAHLSPQETAAMIALALRPRSALSV